MFLDEKHMSLLRCGESNVSTTFVIFGWIFYILKTDNKQRKILKEWPSYAKMLMAYLGACSYLKITFFRNVIILQETFHNAIEND